MPDSQRWSAKLGTTIFNLVHATTDFKQEYCMQGMNVYPTEVLPGSLYIGDASLAGLAASGQLPVQTVVNCSANLNLQSQHVEVLNIPALDEESYPLLTRHLPLFTKFLTARFREGKAVLVNCQAGVNRSVALVVGFLVEAFGLPLLDAVFYVRRRRGKPIL
ncbi:MAG: uncharacterized protein KVP18_005174, partial [Porospora cf. gigantea A]|uniref:uncharacterized protein n=1 Tax=Porospora cf. gigantea A TaxID=2853593 RepID=UPI00355AC2BF